MNERLFRAAVANEETLSAGRIFEVAIPASLKERTVWCYYTNASFTNVGDECWLRFYKNGELAAELPAAYIFANTIRFGVASWREQALDVGIASNVGGGGSLYYSPQNTGNHIVPIQPFKISVDADTATLETNRAGITSAILAVLSFPQP